MTTPAPVTPLRPSTSTPRRRRHRLRRWGKRIGLAALGLAIAGGIIRAWLPKPIAVELGAARRIALDVEVAEEGQTRVRDRFVVSAPISGILQRIELQPGAPVACGDVLARIAPPDPALLDDRARGEAAARLTAAIARHRRAGTAVARAAVARDAAVREADRARTLARQHAIPAAERERAELEEQLAMRDLAAAEAERAGAEAEVAAVRAVLGTGAPRTPRELVPIAAPAAGRVLRVLRDSAGPVAAGAPLLDVGDPRALEVVVDVLSSDAAQIAPGMEVSIEGWGGAPLRGSVRRVEPSAFTRISALGVEEQRVNVIVPIADPPPSLGDGFRVDARIFTWRGAGVLAVPASAVFRDRDRWAVYAVEDGRAWLRPIELGARGRLDVEVAGGLAEGTEIVLHPGDRVTDGVRVQPHRSAR